MNEQKQADAVVPVAVGTALWGVSLVVLLAIRSRLISQGNHWWIWVAATGFGLGLVGSWWVRRRRNLYRSAKH